MKAGRTRTGRMKPCIHCGKEFYARNFEDIPGDARERKFCSFACGISRFADPDKYLLDRIDKNHPSGCWVYSGATDRRGYGRPGRIRPDGSRGRYYAHRRVYELEVGPIPDGMLVLHRCDNPPCCNPAHLFLGTDQDNVTDKMNKGRHKQVGEQNIHAKLTNEEAKAIYARYKRDGRTSNAAELAAEFNSTIPSIHNIGQARTWWRVTGAPGKPRRQ